MLDDVHRQDLVDAPVREGGEPMKVAKDIGLLPGAALDHVDVDVAGQDLVTAPEVQPPRRGRRGGRSRPAGHGSAGPLRVDRLRDGALHCAATRSGAWT